MNVLHFSTAALPPAQRLAAFRQGAFEFQVDAIGDPSALDISWELLRLADVDIVRSSATALRYRRDAAMIDPDHAHRVTIHFHLDGRASGLLDGRTVDDGPGSAQAWDLSRTLDLSSAGIAQLLIVNIPRHLLQEVLPLANYSASAASDPAIAFAVDQIGALVDHAAELPDGSAAALGRAVRDLVVAALLPAWLASEPATLPLETRIADLIDHAPRRHWGIADVADALAVTPDAIETHADRAGGLAALIERRRMLMAYRLLCDPTEEASVSGIAHRCGFDDMPRFSRQFRTVFDRSPSDVRRHQRGVLPRWAGSYMVERHYAAMRDL